MSSNNRRLLGFGVAALAVAFLILGAGRGEVDTVSHKAVNICLECIGLG